MASKKMRMCARLVHRYPKSFKSQYTPAMFGDVIIRTESTELCRHARRQRFAEHHVRVIGILGQPQLEGCVAVNMNS